MLERARRWLRPEEVLLAGYGIALVLLALHFHQLYTSGIFHRRFLSMFLVLALAIFVRGYARARATLPPAAAARRALPAALGVLRDFLPFFFALIFYERLHDLTPLIRPQVVDGALITIDRAVFGVDVPVWMDRFASAPLTQVMVFCYMSYFFAPALLACLIYWSGRRQLFRDFLVSLAVATLMGFIGYLLVPAVGPYLFQADLFPARLPGGGLKITQQVIDVIDGFKGYGRDCFPSLHTAHTTVCLVYAYRFSKRAFFVYLPIAVGLYFSTMYLRMHYAVDVAAGFATAALAVYLGVRLERWWFSAAGADRAAAPTPPAQTAAPG